jgi:hypothetical protein
MADKMNEFRQFLQSSGLHETLQAFDSETARAQPKGPPFNFTFERLPNNNPHTLAFQSHQREDSAMKFDSPYAKKPVPKTIEHRAKSLFNPQVQQPFKEELQSDSKNNEEQFSFGEDISDNEERTKDPDEVRRLQPTFALSDNCIRIQHTSDSNSRAPAHNGGNVFQFHNTATFATAPQNPANNLLGIAKNTNYESPSDFANQIQIRPRSIQSRNNSVERDSSNSDFIRDRQLTPETPVSIHFSDPCLFTRH